MKRLLIIFGLVVAGLSITLYFELRSQRLASEGPSGSSATIEGTEVDVVSRVGGRILSIDVREGAKVKKGQQLVTLDCPEQKAAVEQATAAVGRANAGLQGAKVSVEMAKKSLSPAARRVAAARASAQATQASKAALEAQLTNAKRQKDRIENLVAHGVGTPEALDRARTAVVQLQNQLDALQSQSRVAGATAGAVRGEKAVAALQVDLAQKQVDGASEEVKRAQAALSAAQAMYGECSLTAPRDAYVETRNYEPGEVVLPGTSILTLVDTHEVKAIFYLPNRELGAAKPKRQVKVVADAYPDRSFDGTIRRVAQEAEFTPRNVQTREDRDRLVYAVEATIPNPDDTLRPGMPVEVTIPGTAKR